MFTPTFFKKIGTVATALSALSTDVPMIVGQEKAVKITTVQERPNC